MVNRIAWVLLIGVVVYLGYLGVNALIGRVEEVTEEVPNPIEERILLDNELFFEDFGKQKVIHLRTFEKGESVLVDHVSEPRPLLGEIVLRHGSPDRQKETDLSQHGIRQEMTVHYYGRLGLGVPNGQDEEKVSWVILK